MRIFAKHYHPPGTEPGTLRSVTAEAPFSIKLVDFSHGEYEERALATVADCRPFLDRATTTWIHVQGGAPPAILYELGDLLDLHLLALEDVLNKGQRAKAEEYEEQVFVVMQRPVLNQGDRVVTEQISLFAGEGFVVSFCDAEADPFDLVRDRLRRQVGTIRRRKSDYLLYALVDSIVDEAFPLLEIYGERIEALEDELLARPDQDTLTRIHHVRRDLLLLRRTLWPQREVLAHLYRGECACIEAETRLFLRDCYDHTVQILDFVESYRDMTSSMLEVYLSSVSNRLNESMRVLTVIATIFIPLTFIAGVYGMNFGANTASWWAMPELRWAYGYPAVWVVMILIAAGLLYAFKRRNWF
jgi:magnesium transporter